MEPKLRRLRVGLVTGFLEAGGTERQMLALAGRLPTSDFEVDFLLLARRGSNADQAEQSGNRVQVIEPPVRRSELSVPAAAIRLGAKAINFVRAVRQGDYDILDAWLYHAYVLSALTRPVTRVPVLISGRRSLPEPRGVGGREHDLLDRLSGRMSDAIVANSEQVSIQAISRGRLDPSKVRTIRNGVEVPPLATEPERQAIRRSLGYGSAAFLVGNVANYRVGKGHELLIRAVAQVSSRLPAVRLVLVGEGPIRSRLESLVAQLQITDKVLLLGFHPRPEDLLQAFDLMVQPSEAEGLPNAVLEGAAAGRPIVATAVGGTVEIVKNEQTGLLVAADEGAIADAIFRLAEHPERRRQLGIAARSLAERDFSMERFVSEFAQLYLEQVALSRRPSR